MYSSDTFILLFNSLGINWPCRKVVSFLFAFCYYMDRIGKRKVESRSGEVSRRNLAGCSMWVPEFR